MFGYLPKNELLIRLLDSRTEAAESSGKLSSSMHSGISDEAGALIGRLVLQRGITRALEIGMANGFSTLFILDAMDQLNEGTLLSLDPYQSSDWNGIALERVRTASFKSKHRLIEQPIWLALPDLISEKLDFQMIFIDGSHAFDNVFVDFFLSDKLLAEGGILIFDDVGWAGVERVLHYVMINRNYACEKVIPRQVSSNLPVRFKQAIKRLGERISRTHRTPTGPDKEKIEIVNGAAFLVLRKVRHRAEERFRYF